MTVQSSKHREFDGVHGILEQLARQAGAEGVALLGFATGTESLLVLDCHPVSLTGRRLSVISRFTELAGKGVLASQDLVLPTTLTRWLGSRPRHVCLHPLSFAGFSGLLLFCWKLQPPAEAALAGILATAANPLAKQVERHMTLLAQRRLAAQFSAIMNNISLGIAFTDATGRSTLNPIAADLLGLDQGESTAVDVARAMRERRASCQVQPGHAADLIGLTATISRPSAAGDSASAISEYWVFPAESKSPRRVVLLESYAVGDNLNPGRAWVFSDVTPLWNAATSLQETNAALQQYNEKLAAEIEKRTAAEAALRESEAEMRRYAEDLEFTRSSIEQQAHQAVELAEELAVQKQELEESKRQSDYLANHDPLTGLFNRRAFCHHLQQSLDIAHGMRGQIAVLFIDLDKFKAVNDTLGHDAGDQLLRSVARILGETLRDTDLIARFGGDEFAIATRFPSYADLGLVTALAERIRQRLQISMPTQAGAIEVCGTIGIATFPADADGMDGLFIAADQAMYAGKKRGRNCVTLYKDLPAEG